MSLPIELRIDIRQWQAFIHRLGAQAVNRAFSRAVKKTSAWIITHTARRLAPALKIPVKVIKQRLMFYMRGVGGKVFFGFNPLKLHRLGKVRGIGAPARNGRPKGGLAAGRHRARDGWQMPKSIGAKSPIFRRSGAPRKPIELSVLEWSAEAEAVFSQVASEAEARLLVIFQQEINFELQRATR